MDELAARAAALVARRPRDTRLRRVGVSRAGTPLWLLSVGHGSRQALVVAGPHADEPVGGGTVLRLAERVLAGPRLTEGADAPWNLLLCLDPDGLRRNEGRLSGPYTLGRYFRHLFRPGFLEQPEWLPDGAQAAALPETRALLGPVDDYLLVRPGRADAWDPDAGDPVRPLPPLNTAHLAALRIAGRRIAVRTAGLLHQLVAGSGRDPDGALPELDALIDAWCADYHDGLGARWIPVARQAEYRTRVVLAAFELAARPACAPARSGEQDWGTGPAVPMHRE